MRHGLDGVGEVWCWFWPLPRDPRELVAELLAAGVTGVVPQQSAAAVEWARRWAPELRDRGLSTVVGLGKVSRDAILRGLDLVPLVRGVMVDQEDWKSVPDSRAVVSGVLKRRPDAPGLVADCFYPCLTRDNETGKTTGHARIGVEWAPLCGLRAPQAYWARGGGGHLDGCPEGFVAARMVAAREQYPTAGGSPADRVRPSVQLYRRAVADHVELLLRELVTGSVWLWDWAERDASAVVALHAVEALGRAGFGGPGAVEGFQAAHGLVVDGVVGPKTCRALGVDVPRDTVWRRRA